MARTRGRETVVRTVARSLASDIMGGVYPVGARLPVESDLAEKLNVGRSTVREAVKMLASKGLLIVAPKRGTTVRPSLEWRQLDPDLLGWRRMQGEEREMFMRHLTEIRSMFEPFTAEMAAQRRTDAEMTAIYRALADMREASPETAAAVDADISFHEAIAAGSGNPLLRQLAHSLEPALRHAFDAAAMGLESAYSANLGLHQDIADAIARQEPAKAAAACRRLIARSEQDRKQESAGGGSRARQVAG